MEKYREEGHRARGLAWLGGLSLDFRLGWRMLLRYPALTAVAVLAMAFGIAFGAGAMQLLRDMFYPPLAYTEPARFVRLQVVSTATADAIPLTLADLAAWRGKLRSVEVLSAFATRTRDLSVGRESPLAVDVASVTPGAFTLVKPPMLGRALVAEDAEPGAPPVVVLGYDLWMERFGGDRRVLGSLVRIGTETATVVGVMPKDFAFILPSAQDPRTPQQQVWTPLRSGTGDSGPGQGLGVEVFGRLAPGATLQTAGAEVAAAGARLDRPRNAEDGELKPAVVGFGGSSLSAGGSGAAGLIFVSVVFLAVLMASICANVGLLLFARAAAREGEMTVRSALGASRARIVMQLFTEALVLAAVAVVVGIVAGSTGHAWAVRLGEGVAMADDGARLPPWMNNGLAPSTILFAAGLAVLGAVVAGVLPGFQVTRRKGNAGLPGRGAGVRIGRVWTAIIVLQVALTVMLVPIAGILGLYAYRVRFGDPGFPAAQFMSARLTMEGLDGSEDVKDEPVRRFVAAYRTLESRLDASGAGVTFTRQLPGAYHPQWVFEVEGAAGPSTAPAKAQMANVDADFFDVLGAKLSAGRPFRAASGTAEVLEAVVNETFVRERLGGRSAVGRRIRFLPEGKEPGPWLEIVGVVRDLTMSTSPGLATHAGVYVPLRPSSFVGMAVRMRGDAPSVARRMRDLASDIDPRLRVEHLIPLNQTGWGNMLALDGWFRIILLGSALGLLLAQAGIYAVVSFTVSRRTPEIGVRVALGARPRQIVATIVGRMSRNVVAGSVLGAVLGLLFLRTMTQEIASTPPIHVGAVLALYMVAMIAVCMLACVVPTRRALTIQPSQALNSDG